MLRKLLGLLVLAAAEKISSRYGFLEPEPLFTEIEDGRDDIEVPLVPIASFASLQSKEAQGDAGVVCASFLNPSLQQQELAMYLLMAQVSPEGFANETERLCADANFPVHARPAYDGSWAGMQPGGADIEVMRGLGNWVKDQAQKQNASAMTWGKFAKPNNGQSAGNLMHHVATHPSSIAMQGAVRLLDLGCGSGQDLAAAREAFNATKDNSFCLDIFTVGNDAVTPYALDASSDQAYSASLDKTLAEIGEGTVHVAFSMVTFHHILGAMRPAAISFIKKVLAPGGIFIIAEWDNSPRSGVQNREVYFDLVHFLPTVLFDYAAPASASGLKLSTKYLTLSDRRDEIVQAGLTYDAERSKVVMEEGQLLTPEEMANSSNSVNRDFYLVFSQPTSDTS